MKRPVWCATPSGEVWSRPDTVEGFYLAVSQSFYPRKMGPSPAWIHWPGAYSGGSQGAASVGMAPTRDTSTSVLPDTEVARIARQGTLQCLSHLGGRDRDGRPQIDPLGPVGPDSGGNWPRCSTLWWRFSPLSMDARPCLYPLLSGGACFAVAIHTSCATWRILRAAICFWATNEPCSPS